MIFRYFVVLFSYCSDHKTIAEMSCTRHSGVATCSKDVNKYSKLDASDATEEISMQCGSLGIEKIGQLINNYLR